MRLLTREIRGFHLAILIVSISALTIMVLMVAFYCGVLAEPLDPLVEFFGSCPYREMLGKPCPLCGTTRAAALLLLGDLGSSMEVNPLAAVLLPLGVSQIIYRAVRLFRPRLSWSEELLVGGPCLAAMALILIL